MFTGQMEISNCLPPHFFSGCYPSDIIYSSCVTVDYVYKIRIASWPAVHVASGSGWNLWVWLLGVVVRRYIDFLILLIPTPLVFVIFLQHPYIFLFIKNNVFRSCSSTFL